MNNGPMNGFGMNSNDYNMNGGFPPQDGFGNPAMTTGNPTLDLLNQSNGITPNASAPTNTGNPTLDLLNQSQVQNAQENSYSFVPNMNEETNNADMNNFNQPQIVPAYDNNMGNMMPNYGMNQPLQQPMPGMDMQQAAFGMEQPFAQQPMDYNGQLVQQPLSAMGAVPMPEPVPQVTETPAVENTNPYGFVSMMPTPEPVVEQLAPEVVAPAPEPATSNFDFSFIPLREDNASAVEVQPQMTPVQQPVMPQPEVVAPQQMMPQMPMEMPQAVQSMPGMEQPAYGMEQANMPMSNQGMLQQMAPVQQPVMPEVIAPQQLMPQMPMEMPQAVQPMPGMEQPAYGMEQVNMPMLNQGMPQPMYPEQQGMQQMPMNYNAQMGQMPMGYPQMMQQPAQDPNAIYPGIPDDYGTLPQ